MSDKGVTTVANLYGTLFGVPNTAMGTHESDGSVNYLGLTVGAASVGLGIGEMLGKSIPGAQFTLGVLGSGVAANGIYQTLKDTGTIKLSDVASLGGNVALVALTAARVATPLGAAVTTGLIVTEFGLKIYEIGSKSNGIKLDFLDQNLFYKPADLSSYERLLPPVEVIGSSWETTLRESVTNWTDARSLASVYHELEYQNPLEFANHLAQYAPDNVDALDAWFSGYEAGNYSSSGVNGGSNSSYFSGYDNSYDYSYDTSYDNSFDYSYDYSYDFGGFDPVLVDLDGDGVEIKLLTNSLTLFDADTDGYVERTAWVGADDGLLVIDLGNDGQITDAKEVAFSNWTDAQDTDLQALATTFDSNGDGVFDARDSRFSEFRIWLDANSDGHADEGELQSLDASGINSMALKVADATANTLEDGTEVHGTIDVQRADGKRVQGADVTLAYHKEGLREELDAEGNRVFRLESGDVLRQRRLGAGDDNFTFTDKQWIGATGNAQSNRLDASTASWNVVLEGGAGDDVLLGGSGHDWLQGGDGADTLAGGNGDDVLLADTEDVTAAHQHGSGVNGGDGFDLLLVTGNAALNIDADSFHVEAISTGAGNDNLHGASDAVNYGFDAGGGDDTLVSAGGNDVLTGGAGNDLLDSGAGNDQLLGGEGKDVLKGGAGDDLLAGGSGADKLEGGAGNDVYLLNRGDGADRIVDYAEGEYKEKYSYQEQVSYNEQYNYYEKVRRGSAKNGSVVNELRTGYRALTRSEERTGYRSAYGEVDAGIDTLLFGAGIDIQDIVLERAGNDMRVSLRTAGNEDTLSDDSVTIEDWVDEKNRIENFGFADGNLLDFSQIINAQHGAAGSDQLSGTALGDFISGGSGDDTLVGNAGNDVLTGGSGNDNINGGEGRDLLFAGKGKDAMSGGDGDDYLIADAGDDQLDGGAGNDTLAAMDDNDTLTGGTGNDRLLGGAGRDLLMGGAGDDTYFYFRGDGRDEIFDNAEHEETSQVQVYAGVNYVRGFLSGRWVAQYRTETRVSVVQDDGGNDSLQFGQGIALDDLFVQTSENNLVVALRSGDNASLSEMEDQISIRQWNNAKNRIETFGMADGLTLNMSHIEHAASGLAIADVINGTPDGDLLAGGAGNDSLRGMAGSDYLIGGNGDDSLDGGDGDDDLFGGEGKDTLEGGEGDDYLLGNAGNDIINGGNGNDVISGGTGDDMLNGGRGDDIYHFNRGDGQDAIDESALGKETYSEAYTYSVAVEKTVGSGKGSYQAWVNETRTGYRSALRTIEGGDDTIEFGGNIDIGDVILKRSGLDMIISLSPLEGSNVADSLTVKEWTTQQYRVEHLRFMNDFAVDVATISNAQAGTSGDDVIAAQVGEATWLGGAAGNDILSGSNTADVLHGGTGSDTLNGGDGDDVYIFARGDGRDSITDIGSAKVGTDKNLPGGDKLLFGPDIKMEDLVLSRNDDEMVVYLRDRSDPEAALSGLSDAITIHNWNNAAQRVEVFQFFDGRDFDLSEVNHTFLGHAGANSADFLEGTSVADWMDGFAGDDTLRAGAGNDYLIGGSGHDQLYGADGNDLLSGGQGDDVVSGGLGDDIVLGDTGNDTLSGDSGKDFIFGGAGDDLINGGEGDDVIIGDTGNDTFTASAGVDVYRFGFGDGKDIYIGSEQAGVNGTDIIQLESGIAKEDLWFERVDHDLVMRLSGAADSITFKDWYLSSDPAKNWNLPDAAKRAVYGFEAGGELLTQSKVNSLVSAMAGFTPNDGSTAYGVSASELPGAVRSAINSAWAIAA